MQLSIIIVSFNTKDILKKCLHSIFEHTKQAEFEVIVVDNSSNDGTIEMLREEFTQVKRVENRVNFGYGKANNQGAKVAKGEWLLFLNSDTEIINHGIDSIFTIISNKSESEKEKLVLGCKLLNADGSVQPSLGFFPTLGRVIAQMFFLDDLPLIRKFIQPYQQNFLPFYKHKSDVDWVTGAFLMMPKKLFDLTKGFDEEIFMYGEEIDLCYRLKQKGAKVVFIPDIETYHYKGASSLDGFKAAIIGEYKGLKTFYKKHFPTKLHLLSLTLFFGALLRVGVFGIINQSKARVYWQALRYV